MDEFARYFIDEIPEIEKFILKMKEDGFVYRSGMDFNSPSILQVYFRKNENPFDVMIGYGETKIVLISPFHDYVVKMEKSGSLYNTCQREFDIVKNAKEWALEDIFPETKMVGSYKGISIYLQKKVDITIADINYVKKELLKEEFAKIYKANLSFRFLGEIQKRMRIVDTPYSRPVNKKWIASVYTTYGLKVLHKLIKFMQVEEINDLHDDNLGFTLDGKPIMMDFSGYDTNKLRKEYWRN